MDVNFETFFDYAEFFADSLSNNSNFPLFYVYNFFLIFTYKFLMKINQVGVKAENPSYFTYKSVFSQNQIPVFSNL